MCVNYLDYNSSGYDKYLSFFEMQKIERKTGSIDQFFLSGLPLFDKLKAIRFISYSGTNYSELFGCNRIIRSCSAAIEFDAHFYSVNTFQYEIYSRYSVICALHTTVISWRLASENG